MLHVMSVMLLTAEAQQVTLLGSSLLDLTAVFDFVDHSLLPWSYNNASTVAATAKCWSHQHGSRLDDVVCLRDRSQQVAYNDQNIWFEWVGAHCDCCFFCAVYKYSYLFTGADISNEVSNLPVCTTQPHQELAINSRSKQYELIADDGRETRN